MGKRSSLKNLLWAAAIALCLLALLISLFIAAFSRYRGEKQRGGVHLDGSAASSVSAAPEGIDGGLDAALPGGDGSLHRLGESADAGQGYVNSLTFLVDSTLIGLRDSGILTVNGQATTQVWGSAAGNLPVATLSDCLIRYPGDGSDLSPANAALVTKPSRLVLCLGSDALSQVDEAAFKSNYSALIESLRRASPDTVIIVCSLPSVVPDYNGADGLSSYLVGNANDWIRDVCSETGVYYADSGAALRDANGTLMSEYASANGKTLNAAGLSVFLNYLRSHSV